MGKNILLKIIVGAASLGIAVPVFAQESTPVPPPVKPTVRQEVQNVRQEMKANTEEKRMELKAAAEEKRTELKAAAEQKREEFKQKLDDSKKEVKARIDAKKQELKDRLVKIKDEKKRAVVERIDGRLDALNAKRLEHFSAVLEKLAAVREKINTRVEKAAEKGLDVSAVRTALIAADAAIATSKTAIANQTVKTYTIAVTDEAGLRQNVGAARQALHADLKAVEQTVKDAREALQKAATTLAGIPRANEDDTQPTAQPTT